MELHLKSSLDSKITFDRKYADQLNQKDESLSTGEFFQYEKNALSQFAGHILLKLKPAANRKPITSFTFNVTKQVKDGFWGTSYNKGTVLINIKFYLNNTSQAHPPKVYVFSSETDQFSTQQPILPVKFLNINISHTKAMQIKSGYLIGITFDWIFIDNWVYQIAPLLSTEHSGKSNLHVTWNQNTNLNARSAVVEWADLMS